RCAALPLAVPTPLRLVGPTAGGVRTTKQGAAVRRFWWVRGVVVLGLASALLVPAAVSGASARRECRPAAFVPNDVSGTVSTIDVNTRTKDPTDIPVGEYPQDVAVTPEGKTGFAAQPVGATGSSMEGKTKTKDPTDIPVGSNPAGVAVTPDGKTAFVTNYYSNTVSTIDVKTRTKHPTDIAVGGSPIAVAVTPDGKTAFVSNQGSNTV